MNRVLLPFLCLSTVIVGFVLFKPHTPPIEPKTSIDISVQEFQQASEIYIINGDYEDIDWFAGPSKSEFLKALYEYPQHLFITPSLWKAFCHHRADQLKKLKKQGFDKPFEQLTIEGGAIYHTKNRKKVYSSEDPNFFNIATVLAFHENEWEFYDTCIGLYYLRPKDDVQLIGLKMDQFKKINKPCIMSIQGYNRSWVDAFINLFDIKTWHATHANGRKKIVCLSGHGTRSRHKIHRACGIDSDDFAQLLCFFNDKLTVDVIGVQTCFWPAERIMRLLEKHGKQHLDCHLVTPINKEEQVFYRAEMPLVLTYEPGTRQTVIKEAFDGELLLSGLHDIAQSFKGTVTHELEQALNGVSVVQVNHSHKLKTSLIGARTNIPLLV